MNWKTPPKRPSKGRILRPRTLDPYRCLRGDPFTQFQRFCPTSVFNGLEESRGVLIQHFLGTLIARFDCINTGCRVNAACRQGCLEFSFVFLVDFQRCVGSFAVLLLLLDCSRCCGACGWHDLALATLALATLAVVRNGSVEMLLLVWLVRCKGKGWQRGPGWHGRFVAGY